MKASILRILKNLAHPATVIGLVAALIIPFLVYLTPTPKIGHKEIIQQLDLNLPFPLFIVQFVAGITLLVLLRKDLRDWLKTILPEKKISILMVLFTIAISIFAATQIEARHRVQSDESVFMSVAQNMYYNQESGTCNQGFFKDGKLECTAKSNSFKTKGLAFLYTIGMPFLGKDLHWIFMMELCLLPLAVLLMFLAIVAWTRQPLLAFFAALLMAIQPTVLFQFRSMSVEPLYILLSALSLLIFKWAYDRNTVKHWAILALTLAFFAQTRQETVFCFAPFILFALPRILDKKSAKTPVFFFVLSLFSVPVLLTISYFQGFDFQGGEFAAHGHFWEDVAKNWEVMTMPLRENGELRNPFLSYFNYLFAIGGIYLILRTAFDSLTRKDDSRFFYLKILTFVILYHIQTFVILENVSGDFSIEINQRYSLVMIPTMAFLAALPIAHLCQQLVKYIGGSKSQPLIEVVSALVVGAIFAGWTVHYKEDFNKNIMYNRNHLTIEEYEILKWLGEQPKKDRFFIYGRPWHFIGYGMSSIHYNQARQKTSEELKKLVSDYQGEVYYVRGLDCWDSQTYHKKAVEHRIPTSCDMFERDMELEGVKNILITNNYWVQIAKFHGRRDYNPANVLSVGNIEMEEAADSLAEASLKINISLGETSAQSRQWELNIAIDGNVVAQTPYNRGNAVLHYKAKDLWPGFNQIQLSIKDKNSGKTIAKVDRTYFYEIQGATALTSLQHEAHIQGWGSLHFNRSVENNEMKVAGQIFQNGLGTHAPSTTVYGLNKQFKLFRSDFGLDEESLCSEGVTVQLIGDNRILVESKVFTTGELIHLEANIEGVNKFTIKSNPAKSLDCSHLDIINPTLVP